MFSFSNFVMAFFASPPGETDATTNLEKVFLDIDFQLCYNNCMKRVIKTTKREGII